ncbi:MAG: response regulator [Pseudomonadota bacterium]
MDDLEQFVRRRAPTAQQPLLGMTVLVVEDSRFSCEALRLMCLRSGARIRRADSLKSARRHLQYYQPAIAIVDMGLPDGNGADFIADLASASPRPSVILGTSGSDASEGAALKAGADGFMPKPLGALSVFQEAVLRHLPPDAQPAGPRALSTEVMHPDPLALRDDLAHAVHLLKTGGPDVLVYAAQFLDALGRSAGDGVVIQASADLTASHQDRSSRDRSAAQVADVISGRIAQLDAV